MRIWPWSRAAQNISEKRDALEVQGGGGLTNLSSIWSFLDGGTRFNESGEIVNDQTALSLATVFTCCRILSDSVASLPCKVYRQNPGGKMEDFDNPLAHLLQIEANPECSSYSFMESLVTHLMVRGNGFAEVQRSAAGDPVALWNLDPRKTEPVRLLTGDLAYKTSDGMTQGQTRIVAAKDMLHVVLFSWDGIQGVSPIAMLRQTLGLAISQQKFCARSLANNAVPSLAITIPGKLKPEDKTQARDDWNALNSGPSQRGVAILDGGMGITPLGLSNDDQELLASMSFTRSQIAAAFRVPASMVGDMTRLSNSNHEQQSLSFVQDTLTPILKRIEIEFRRKLLPPAPNGKPNTSFILFDLRERLRGDFASTMAGYATGKQNGFYSTNDIRRELGENPIGPQGDIYYRPVNMVDASQTIDPEPTQPAVVPDAAAAVRDTLSTSAGHMLTLYRDAVGRLAARTADKRDLQTVQKVFGALAASIAELGAESARRSTNAPEWQPDATKAISEYLVSLTKRSATWNSNELDSIAASELQRVTKTLTLAAHRSIAEFTALKGLPNVA
jgi:HK97 family phage portal protein